MRAASNIQLTTIACLLAACSSNGPEPVQSTQRIATSEPAAKEAATPASSGCSSGGVETIDGLIGELERLAGEDAPREKLDAFIAKNPCIVEAEIHPYGSALMRALEFEREQLALALVDAGAEVPEQALALAARGGLDRFIELMLSRGVPPDAGDSWGYTPLHLAAKYDKVSTIQLLLSRGATPTVNATNDGFTALHLAVIDRHVESVKLLIAAGADLEARDHQGRTPLHWGPFAYAPQPKHMYRELGQPHDTIFVDPGEAVVIDLLIDAGAKIDARDEEGNTPLHAATEIGSVRGVEKLLERGADPRAKNDAGQTPMFHVKRRGDDHIKELFDKAR